MKPRIAILAALPREIEPLVRDWPVRISSQEQGTLVAENDRAIAVCAGMGPARVRQAFATAEARGPLSAILSIGYAGALRKSMARNTLHWPAKVLDAATGAAYDCAGGSGTLVTAAHVVGSAEKRELAARWDADLVDMEAAAVARLAQMRGLPFRTLKVVSDEAGDKLPDLNRFIDAHGRFREAAFAWHLARHPWLLPTAVRLGRDANRASASMAQALSEEIARTD